MDNIDKEKKDKETKENDSASKKEVKKDTRSSILVIFGVLIITLTFVSGFLFYQNQKVKEELAKYLQPTPSSTLTPSPTPEPTKPVGYIGYNPDGKRFLLNLPEECGEEYGEEDISIICTTDDSIITINPQARGFGMEGYEPAGMESGEVFVDEYTWDYKIWIDEDGTAFAAYDLTDEEAEDYYLIHVEYDPYSTEAKDYFEGILSTFQFTDSEFVCPDTKVIDCSPCEGGLCPLMFPAYCSKGSAQYNWIVENCPDVTFVGLE